jgi:predicted enzyme related to lactoylglutathione lyase
MSEVRSYEAGMPAWVELTTSDPEASRRFYGELFGWEFQVGSAETMHYTTCLVRGHRVAGMAGDPAPAGTPTAWTTYLASGDVDDTARRVTAAGGRLTTGPTDVMDQGRMVIAIDPTGAVFGLWQAGQHPGASLASEPGAVSWTELQTGDLDAAQAFCTAIFGYTWQEAPGGLRYATFSVSSHLAGGALAIPEEWHAGDRPHPRWLTYFAVNDADSAAASTERLGGGVLFPPQDSPFGRFAVLRDPQGATFNAIRPPSAPQATS